MEKRGRNLKRYRLQGAKTARFVAAGHNAVGLWGSRVTGLTDGDISKMRCSTAASMLRMSAGQSAARSLAATGHQRLDPAFAANAGPLEEWAVAVWDGYPSLQVLNLALKGAKARIAAAKTPWKIASDVAVVFLLTLARIGWSADSARYIRTHDGGRLDLLSLAPKVVVKLAKAATQAWSEKKALGGADDSVMFWKAFAKLRKVGDSWTAHHAKVAVKVLANGQCPGVSRGEDGTICEFCGCAWSVYHAVFECDATQSDRMQLTSLDLRQAAHALKDHKVARERFARGLLPHPGSLVPAGSFHGEVRWINKPVHGMDGLLFTDGSAIGVEWEVSRAGWAVVQVTGEGDLISAAYGPVPMCDCPLQTIADAEDYALAMLPVLAMTPIEVYVDRQQTVNMANGCPRAATSVASPRAHLWVRYFTAFEGENVRVLKTLAHATAGDVDAGRTTEWERKGNALADKYAKLGAAMHGMSELHLQQVAAIGSLAEQAVRWAAETFRARQALAAPITCRRAAGIVRAQRSSGGRKTRAPVEPGVAPGPQLEWQADDDAPGLGEGDLPGLLRHSVHIARVYGNGGAAMGSIAYCALCGAYFWRRIGRLAAPCERRSANSQARRLARGLFPASGQHYAGLWISGARRPNAVELAEVCRQVQAAAGDRVRIGPGAWVPRRRLMRKTAAPHLGPRHSNILAAYGLQAEGALDTLTRNVRRRVAALDTQID
jgi:hypothetical protein